MSLYFFNTQDGARHEDDQGAELRDAAEARVQAIVYAGSIMADEPGVLWDGREFNVYATDASGLLLFTITCYATNAPAAGDIK